MEAIDVQGLHPRFAASVVLLAARKGRPVAGLTPLVRKILAGRDPLGASSIVESDHAGAFLSGPDGKHHLTIEREGGLLVVAVQDLVPTLTKELWPPLELGQRVRDGWWVSEHDLIDALLLLTSGAVPSSLVMLSGRRRWSSEELIREAGLLQRRWTAGQGGAFSVDVLAESHRPPVRVEAVVQGEKEPDLAPLHSLLTTRQSEGWRPQMTVREALMHHLALNDGLNLG
jgi:hypothetical protein